MNPSPKGSEHMAGFDLAGHVILLVDDVAFSRETVRRVLRAMNEPSIIDASNGAQALTLLNSKPDITLVIADFNMPIGNGMQLLQAIRAGKSQAERTLPVAMLTGHSDQHLVASALALDVNAFIVKPVSADAIGKRLMMMLQQVEDASWIKDPEEYENVPFVGSINSRSDGKIPASGSEDADASDADVLVPDAKVEEVRGLAFELASTLTKAETKRPLKDTASEIEQGVRNLIIDAGISTAESVLSFCESSLSAGRITSYVLAKALTEETRSISSDLIPAEKKSPDYGAFVCALVGVPEGAVLAGDLKSRDGKMVVNDGTPLSPRLVSVIRQLQRIGELAPQVNDGVDVGIGEVSIRFYDAKSSDGSPMELVPADRVQIGSVLANDLFLTSGRPYMPAGAEFTDRSVTLLQDLSALQGVENGVWIRS